MEVATRPFGDGTEVFVVGGAPGHSFTVTPFGAHLVTVRTPDRNGASGDVALGFDDVDGYRAHASRYFGSTIGRYANRIGGARFKFDGEVHRLDANEGAHHLHGGNAGFSRRVWSAEVVDTPDLVGVRLSYTSPAGEAGYPGTLTASTTYAWSAATLVVLHEAFTDAPTVVSMTNHTYWTLGGSMADHRLFVSAEAVLATDDALIPTGKLTPVGGTALDLRAGPVVADVIDATGGLDHCYVLTAGDGGALRHAGTLSSGVSGRRMEVWTDQDAMVVYSANDAGPFPRHSAVCLETHGYPDAPNRPEFPSATLRPGERYRQHTEYRFTAA